ncbi:MAG: DUF368 domain-containing protein [Anaeroplasmataceae bacterium]|nr:DUF368 domain-containing protein [Anaeroplasmataceae bacterium]
MEEKKEIDLKYKDKKETLMGTVLGFFIGLAIIVPGISGSTMAIIFKLYDKLLYAIGNLINKFKYSFLFLLPILVGAILGFSLGFFGIQFLLDLLPFAIMAFFAGLMIGAFPAVTDEIRKEKLTLKRILLFLLGLSIPIVIGITSTFVQGGNNSLENLKFYHYILFLFLGYVVAITQVVPGLSATALLMAFGYFVPIMESVKLSYIQNNPSVLLVYACLVIGFIIGLISFSKILTLIFNKGRKTAFFMIVGLSLGSIVSMFFNPDIYKTYLSWANGDVLFGLDLGLGIGLLIIGAIIAYLFVKYERNHFIELEKE